MVGKTETLTIGRRTGVTKKALDLAQRVEGSLLAIAERNENRDDWLGFQGRDGNRCELSDSLDKTRPLPAVKKRLRLDDFELFTLFFNF
ncbi:hypothetical protein C1J03_19970 [Sulfitobacter sp. SK012]|nr:hypothetical protein C1J03_19970 [Sulfitobacter sp. SK012]